MKYVSLDQFLSHPGKATAAAAVYIHDGKSVQSHLEVYSKSDAEKIAAILDELVAVLRDGLNRGKFISSDAPQPPPLG